MVRSKYITDILEHLLDGDDAGLSAKQQLHFITEENLEYTPSGLFVTFAHSDGIAEHKVADEDLILDGVEIHSTEFPIQAHAFLYFSNGIISLLEIWCYLGNYPVHDLKEYTLIHARALH